MTLDRSATIMDAIFASPDEESRGRLLRIMQEFLVSEAAKHSTKEKGTVVYASHCTPILNFVYSVENAKGKAKNVEVNMEELVGNTDGFADSGYVLCDAYFVLDLKLHSVKALARLLSNDILAQSWMLHYHKMLRFKQLPSMS
jgi:hypothetical protein